MDDKELKDLFGKENDEETPDKDGAEVREPEDASVKKSEEAKKAEAGEKSGPEEKTEDKDKPVLDKKPEPESKAAPDKKPAPIPSGRILPENESEPFPISPRTMLLMILGVLLLIFVLSVAFHPFFRVKTIKISGNAVLSDQEILDEIGIDYNDHLFAGVSGNIIDIAKLDYGNTEKRIESENPYISDIEISVSFPSTINIKVTERQKVAYVKVPDGYAAIDTEGIVLELDSNADDSVRPLICGLDIDSVVIGKKLQAADDSAYQKMIIVLGAVLAADSNSGVNRGYSFFENLIEVRMLPSGNFFLTLYLPKGTILQVKLKNIDTINEDMAQLCFSILEGAFDNLPDGVLDMTDEELIYREYD